MDIHVETHSGYKADEYPVRFTTGGRTLEVVDVEDRWYSPDAEYFRVMADDAGTYLLRHCLSDQHWELVKPPTGQGPQDAETG